MAVKEGTHPMDHVVHKATWYEHKQSYEHPQSLAKRLDVPTRAIHSSPLEEEEAQEGGAQRMDVHRKEVQKEADREWSDGHRKGY